MMKLYQFAGKTLLNIDLSELTMSVLWDSLNTLRNRSAVWTFSFEQDLNVVCLFVAEYLGGYTVLTVNYYWPAYT